jgi:hypothetical protein
MLFFLIVENFIFAIFSSDNRIIQKCHIGGFTFRYTV